MAIFDYKNLGLEKSKSLMHDAINFAAYTNEVRSEVPKGYKLISAEELNYSGHVDERGTFYGESLQVLSAQVDVLGKYDAQGALTSIGVSFRGTGGPAQNGVLDYVLDFVNNFQAAFDPAGFGTQYPDLAFGRLLGSIADFAEKHHLSGKDIFITGASLGGMTVNSMADLSDKNWNGFYKDSHYVAAVSPTQSTTGKVINVGAENDPVYRLMGNQNKYSDEVFGVHDVQGQSTTDNIVSFNDHYVDNLQSTIATLPPGWVSTFLSAPLPALGVSALSSQLPQSVANPLSWLTHNPDEIVHYAERILESKFYDHTYQDSTIIVSNLTEGLRGNTWVERLEKYGIVHTGPQFILGTDTDDKIRGSHETSYLEGGAGNDTFQDGGGYNVILGGSGHDTMELKGSLSQFEIAYDATKDGSNGIDKLYIRDSKGAISILSDMETLTTQEAPSPEWSWAYVSKILGSQKDTVSHDVTANGLKAGDTLEKYAHSVNGDDSDNYMSANADGDWLFGKGGNDLLLSNKANVTFVGDIGNDIMISDRNTGNNTFLFSDEFGHDTIKGFQHSDHLVFMNVAGVTDNFDFHSFASQKGSDTVLTFGDNSVTLVGISLEGLSAMPSDTVFIT